MTDWDDIRYFLAVIRTGRTSAAAQVLGVNQSTVVRRIAALEDRLSLRLFEKRRDGYRLTRAGAALREEALAAEASMLAFARHASSLDTDVAGSLGVTMTAGIALRLMPSLLKAFHLRHPELQVSLFIEDQVRDLGEGYAEVALRPNSPGNPALVGRKLAEHCWAVYGSRDYVAREGQPAVAEELSRHRLVAPEPPLDRVNAALWLREVAPEAAVACRSNNVLGLLVGARAGAGLALLPCHLGDPDPGLVRVLDPPPGLTSDLWILTHRDLHKMPKVRAFFDFMAREIASYKPLLLGQTGPGRA